MKLGARIVCGRKRADGKACHWVVPEDGRPCFAHSKAGLRMRAEQLIKAEAMLIAQQGERLRAAKEETELLLLEELRLRDTWLIQRRELDHVNGALLAARAEHDRVCAALRAAYEAHDALVSTNSHAEAQEIR
jgi:hypothetical protein